MDLRSVFHSQQKSSFNIKDSQQQDENSTSDLSESLDDSMSLDGDDSDNEDHAHVKQQSFLNKNAPSLTPIDSSNIEKRLYEMYKDYKNIPKLLPTVKRIRVFEELMKYKLINEIE